MGMHNKGTYTRVLTYAYTRIDIRVYAYRHTRIRKIRAYNTRMRSSDISELHCSLNCILSGDDFNPLTPGAFQQIHIFGHFRDFQPGNGLN